MEAVGAVWNMLCSGKLNAWKDKNSLNSSLVSSVAMYTSHIWGLGNGDIVEQVQSFSFKGCLV